MTLLKTRIEIPERIDQGDFVLNRLLQNRSM